MDVQAISFSGLAIVLLARTVWELVRDRRNNSKNNQGCSLDRSKTIHKIDDLHQMHSKTNADGAPIWYFPQSIEPNIEKMVKHLENIEKGINGK